MENFERGLTMLMFMWGVLILIRRHTNLGASPEKLRVESSRLQWKATSSQASN